MQLVRMAPMNAGGLSRKPDLLFGGALPSGQLSWSLAGLASGYLRARHRAAAEVCTAHPVPLIAVPPANSCHPWARCNHAAASSRNEHALASGHESSMLAWLLLMINPGLHGSGCQ